MTTWDNSYFRMPTSDTSIRRIIGRLTDFITIVVQSCPKLSFLHIIPQKKNILSEKWEKLNILIIEQSRASAINTAETRDFGKSEQCEKDNFYIITFLHYYIYTSSHASSNSSSSMRYWHSITDMASQSILKVKTLIYFIRLTCRGADVPVSLFLTFLRKVHLFICKLVHLYNF